MATTYLGREVFELQIDWMNSPGASVDGDLKAIRLAFNEPDWWTDQEFPAWAWEFDVNLDDQAAIVAYERFFDRLNGTLRGFWLPVPNTPMLIVAGVDASTITIQGSSLAAAFPDMPALHVRFEKTGQTARHAPVETVTDNLDGTSTVDFDSFNLAGIDSSWTARRLAYVRQAGNVESLEFESEQRAFASVKVIELPQEYAVFEYGQRLIWLYDFSVTAGGVTFEWRATSYPSNIIAVPDYKAIQITHENLTRNATGDRDSVTIKAVLEPQDTETPGTPFAFIFPALISMRVNVTISFYRLDDPGRLHRLFVGRLSEPQISGRMVTVEAKSWLDLASAPLPGLLMQRRCNYMVFGVPCGVTRATFIQAVTMTPGATPTEWVIAGAGLTGLAYGWFAEGVLETTGIGAYKSEKRMIVSSTVESGGSITITLSHPLTFPTTAGHVTPGCDGRSVTCIGKFNNFVNFGGHGFAHDNLTLKALPAVKLDGAKK